MKSASLIAHVAMIGLLGDTMAIVSTLAPPTEVTVR